MGLDKGDRSDSRRQHLLRPGGIAGARDGGVRDEPGARVRCHPRAGQEVAALPRLRFAFDESSAGVGYEEDAAYALSAGTEAVLVTRAEALSYFRYYVDSVEITAFEPLLAWDRFGTEPDRFLPYMRRTGVRLDDDDAVKDPVIAVLEMVTLALGISLSKDTALGPLLTVQRD
jgi:hypothetical protein